MSFTLYFFFQHKFKQALNSNTNAAPVFVGGNVTVKTGSTLRSQGTGFEVQGNLVLNGTVNYANSNTTFVFTGSQNQIISGAGTIPFRNLQLNKLTTAATVTLLNPATVSGTALFTNGCLNTTTTNVLTFSNGSTATGATVNSFVNGPVRKTGNSAFVFPTGKTGNYQPIAISPPASAAATYIAEYFHQNAGLGTNKDVTIDSVSNCEYWTLNNVGFAYPVRVTVGWNNQSCYINPNIMQLVAWSGIEWGSLGNSSTNAGNVTSYTPVNLFGYFTLAQALLPEVSFASIDTINIGYPVTFTNTSLRFNPTTKFIWKFGNLCSNNSFYTDSRGNEICTDSTIGTISISHVYNVPGNYTVQLSAKDLSGNSYSFAKSLFVNFPVPTSEYCEDPADYCNIITNSGIEFNSSLPSGLDQLWKTCEWHNATSATPDYFSAGATGAPNLGVPSNLAGNQAGFGGSNSYLGFIAYDSYVDPDFPGPPWQEYVYQELTTPLIAGATYQISFSVSLSDFSRYATNKIGAWLTTNANLATYSNISSMIPVVPQIVSSGYITNSTGWVTISQNYVATGNEQVIVIGNYGTNFINAGTTTPIGQFQTLAYYYLDNISIKRQFIATATPSPQTICPGGTTSISLSSNIPGTTYTWTAAPSFGITGASSGSGNIIAQTLNSNNTTAGTVVYTVTPSISGCSGNPINVTVIVRPRPIVIATPVSQTICSGTSANISLLSLNPGATFSWIVSQSGASGATPGSGNTISQILSATGTNPGIVTYTITPTANGCVGAPITATVTVNPSSCCLPNMITLTGNISNYTGSNTNQNFNVTGTLIINQNYTFAGCNIIMAPNAVIQVNSGRTLNITNKTHIYACTTMWDRITVQNNATLNILNNSLIEDGTRAVYIANGGHVVARNVIFNKNLRAIELAANNAMVSPVALTASVITSRNIAFFSNTAQNPTAAAVWANIISQNPTYLPATIKAPYSCVKGNYGVYATNVRTLNIGATTAGFNGFDEILCGVFITSNSGSVATTIYNNKFRNIKGYFFPSCFPSAPFVSEEGYGVRAFSSSTGAPVITVGGTGANQTNDFYNIYSAVRVEGYKNVTVIKNTFDNYVTGPFLFGGQINYGNAAVSVFNPLIQNIINASQNTIKNCATGIFVNRLTNASCTSQAITLSNNNITSNGTSTGYCVNGISIQNGNNSTATPYDAIKIQQNTITQVQHCITASNVKRGLLISLNPNLGIAYDAAAQRNGIRLISCENAKVLNNCYIHSMQANTYTQANADMRGIYVYNTRGVQVQCNQVWDVTKGMLFEANCVSSNFATSVRYNKLNNAYYGLYMLNSAQIGTQGSAFPPTASENYWFGNYTWQTYVNNVTNVNTASRFYVRNGSAFTIPTNNGASFLPLRYMNGTGIIAITAPAYGACTCASAIAPPDEPPVVASMAEQSATVAALVEDTVSTDVFAENVKWQNQKFAYQKIDNTISMATGNSVLTNFYATANHNIKQLSRVEKYLFNYNAAFAHAINGGIQPHGVMEENQQRVNELLLLNEINSNYVYSEVQIEDAYNIAVQCPITGGDAVIQARALYSYMIGSLTEFEDDCNGATQRSMVVSEADDEENKNNIRLYPNPNDGNMTLEYQIDENKIGELIIYDITGKRLQSYNFNSGSSQLSINASTLNAGVYLYDVFISNVKVKTDRVIIVK